LKIIVGGGAYLNLEESQGYLLDGHGNFGYPCTESQCGDIIKDFLRRSRLVGFGYSLLVAIGWSGFLFGEEVIRGEI
jgi:hypothetical protein